MCISNKILPEVLPTSLKVKIQRYVIVQLNTFLNVNSSIYLGNTKTNHINGVGSYLWSEKNFFLFKEFHHFSYYVSHMCKITPAAVLVIFPHATSDYSFIFMNIIISNYLPLPTTSTYVYLPLPTFLTRGCVGRKFSSDWGDMCNLAFIGATILNFGLA